MPHDFGVPGKITPLWRFPDFNLLTVTPFSRSSHSPSPTYLTKLRYEARASISFVPNSRATTGIGVPIPAW